MSMRGRVFGEGTLPPNILAGYNNIVPGAAERLIAMAESDVQHLRFMEKAEQESRHAIKTRGQFLGFAIAVVAFATAAYALYLGHEGAAAKIGGTTIIGLVAIFVLGRVIGNSRH